MTLFRIPSMFAMFAALAIASSASAADWIHWRGPEMTGQSKDKNLPSTWSPDEVGKNNLIWKAPYGCRSAPLVMNGRVYVLSSADSGVQEGEQVVCVDEKTGKTLWKHKFNVFHTDIVSSRLGWTFLTADPALEYVYAHGTQGLFFCFDKDGKIVWSRSLTEEFGRVTGYGGRIPSPICDSGLVIQGMINSSWGDQARGLNRYVAMDAKTGEVVWWSEPGGAIRFTHNSTPVIGVINGERVLVSGGADGLVHCLQVRTGKKVWSYPLSGGVINGSPIVVGDMVYIGHGDESLNGIGAGGFVCLDGSKVTNGKPKMVWEFAKGVRFGLANPAYADGVIYAPDDFAKLHGFDAKTGKVLFPKYNYGRLARGSPLIADGKCYIFDVNSHLHILKLTPGEEPEELHKQFFRDTTEAGFVETNCTPIAVNGRLYFATRDELYCVGNPDSKGESVAYTPLPKEAEPTSEVAWLQLFPADVTVKTGDKVTFQVRAFDKLGQQIKAELPAVTWTLPQPPLPPMAKMAPPALKGEIANGVLTLDAKMPSQHGYVEVAISDKLKARARVRVAPQIPYANDFEKIPEGAAPGGWINTQGKFVVAKLDGVNVLMKTNTSGAPPIARGMAYIVMPTATGYTLECDMMAVEANGKLPDMGLIVNRYTFILDGKTDSMQPKRKLRIGAWEAIPRVKQEMEFDWKSKVWYHLKMTVEVQPGNKAIVRGKVWERDQKEPEAWTIEYTDPNALPSGHQQGSAGIYGFVTNVLADSPGSPIYYDNLKITPNK